MIVNWVAGKKVHRIGLPIPYFKSEGWDQLLEAIECAVRKERQSGNLITKICFGNDLPEWQQIIDLGVIPDSFTEASKDAHSKEIVFSACREISLFAHSFISEERPDTNTDS